MSEGLTRRALLCRGLLGAAAFQMPMPPRRARAVIVLSMDGGPSQFDTWAPEPGGLFGSIATTAPALRFCKHMPRMAQHGHRLAVLADVSVPEINHRRARYLLRTGVQAPPSVVPEVPAPSVSALPMRRLPESAQRYGVSDFGRQCWRALVRIERGERYAEAALPGWDTHTDAEPRRRRLLPLMDRAMAALLDDLVARDLLRSTLVVWMGEFGRTPTINRMGGRDHDPDRSCIVLAGAGVRGGVIMRGHATPLADVFATIASVSPLYRRGPYCLAAAGRPIRDIMA